MLASHLSLSNHLFCGMWSRSFCVNVVWLIWDQKFTNKSLRALPPAMSCSVLGASHLVSQALEPKRLHRIDRNHALELLIQQLTTCFTTFVAHIDCKGW